MKRGSSLPAAQIMMSSITETTCKQYKYALEEWNRFCSEYGIEFYDPAIDDVQNFLVNKFIQGASYGTLNTTRCALSLISKNKVGENPLITRLMKGFYKLRPTAPKYQATWDVSIVLRYLKKAL